MKFGLLTYVPRWARSLCRNSSAIRAPRAPAWTCVRRRSLLGRGCAKKLMPVWAARSPMDRPGGKNWVDSVASWRGNRGRGGRWIDRRRRAARQIRGLSTTARQIRDFWCTFSFMFSSIGRSIDRSTRRLAHTQSVNGKKRKAITKSHIERLYASGYSLTGTETSGGGYMLINCISHTP